MDESEYQKNEFISRETELFPRLRFVRKFEKSRPVRNDMHFFGRDPVVFYRVQTHFVVNYEMSVFKNCSVEFFPVDFYVSADVGGMERDENFDSEARNFFNHFKKFVRIGEKNESVLYVNNIGFYFGHFLYYIVSEITLS